MLTKTIDLAESHPDLKELLSWVAEGSEVVLMEGGTPIARLVSAKRRIAGLHRGAIWVSPDFDEPLSEDLWVSNE